MKSKRREAIDQLMSHTDETTAEILGVRVSTVRQWLSQPDFARALRQREREQKASLARIARQAALNAAVSLCQSAEERPKVDSKAAIDVLKVSGAFEAEAEDPGAALAEVRRLCEREESASAR